MYWLCQALHAFLGPVQHAVSVSVAQPDQRESTYEPGAQDAEGLYSVQRDIAIKDDFGNELFGMLVKPLGCCGTAGNEPENIDQRWKA